MYRHFTINATAAVNSPLDSPDAPEHARNSAWTDNSAIVQSLTFDDVFDALNLPREQDLSADSSVLQRTRPQSFGLDNSEDIPCTHLELANKRVENVDPDHSAHSSPVNMSVADSVGNITLGSCAVCRKTLPFMDQSMDAVEDMNVSTVYCMCNSSAPESS